MCTDQPQISITVDLTGTATFGQNGSFSTEQSQGDPGMACMQIVKGMLDSNGDCVVPGKPQTQMKTSSGTFTTQGGNLMIVDSSRHAGPSNDQTTYCVQGNTLTAVVKSTDSKLAFHYTATRK